MACHKPHDRLDYVKTYFAMAGKRVETNPAPVSPTDPEKLGRENHKRICAHMILFLRLGRR